MRSSISSKEIRIRTTSINFPSSLSACTPSRSPLLTKSILAEATAIATMASTAMSLPRQPCCKAHTPRIDPVSNSSPLSYEFSKPSVSFFRRVSAVNSQRIWRRRLVSVRSAAEEVTKPNEVTQAKGLSLETGGQWLSSTTRHIRIYAGYVDPVTKVMDQSQLDKLTLMLDPDNEFVWPEERVQQVYNKYKELVDDYAGADLSEYTLRLIGSDLEHYIRKMLLAGELKYNLECRVLNFSMGRPRIDPADLDDVEEEE